MILVAFAATVGYLLFLLAPGNRGTTWLWLVTLGAECLAALHGFGTWWTILAHDDQPESGDVIVRRRDLVQGLEPAPTVDVFITACGEDVDLVMATVVAARDMRLAHRTIVLDDADSDALADRCRASDVEYRRRSDRAHAKAGNVNAGLAATDGEYVLILDADHVPTADFLVQVLPHFVDPTVAFVQAPQSYRDGHGIIATGAGEAQRIFYELVCPGKNKFNAAFCVGTNVVFRRGALEEIDGIHTGSNSEDIWTSLDLHRRGWRSVYIPQVLAKGLAPDTIGSFIKQQHRWASGGFEILTRGRLFRRDRKLTLDQRLQYLFVGTHYLLSVAMLVFMCLPATYLMFGLSPIRSGGWDWASHYLPFYVATLAVTWLQSGGFRLSAIVTSIASAPTHLRALVGVLAGRKASWAVTNSARRGSSSLWSVMPHIFLISVNACAIVVGLSVFTAPAPTLLSIGWASVHISLLSRVVFEALRPDSSVDRAERSPTPKATAAPDRSKRRLLTLPVPATVRIGAGRLAASVRTLVPTPLADRGKVVLPALLAGAIVTTVLLSLYVDERGSSAVTPDRGAVAPAETTQPGPASSAVSMPAPTSAPVTSASPPTTPAPPVVVTAPVTTPHPTKIVRAPVASASPSAPVASAVTGATVPATTTASPTPSASVTPTESDSDTPTPAPTTTTPRRGGGRPSTPSSN
jgi:cellulose synthase (UDP-forming)